MEKLKVVIVDDSEPVVKLLCSILSKDKGIQVAGTAKNAEAGYQMIKEHKPDVVLMDLIMPRLEGFHMMERVQKDEKITRIPKFIIITSERKDGIVQDAFRLGADFYIMKPFDGEVLLSRIHYIAQKKDWKTQQREQEDIRKRQGKLHKWTMEEAVGRLVQEMGVSTHVKGYFYLRDAVIMVVNNAEILDEMIRTLYPAVAIIHGTTPACVERAMRHAIEMAWTRGKIENIERIFGYSICSKGEKPTNTEVIALLSDKIRLQYEDKEDNLG